MEGKFSRLVNRINNFSENIDDDKYYCVLDNGKKVGPAISGKDNALKELKEREKYYGSKFHLVKVSEFNQGNNFGKDSLSKEDYAKSLDLPVSAIKNFKHIGDYSVGLYLNPDDDKYVVEIVENDDPTSSWNPKVFNEYDIAKKAYENIDKDVVSKLNNFSSTKIDEDKYYLVEWSFFQGDFGKDNWKEIYTIVGGPFISFDYAVKGLKIRDESRHPITGKDLKNWLNENPEHREIK